MAPPTQANARAVRSVKGKHDAITDGRSPAPQANATITKRSTLTKRPSVTNISIPLVFLVGPDSTSYPLDQTLTAKFHEMTSYVRDLWNEIREVRRIRRNLQVAGFAGNEFRDDMDAETIKSAVLQLEQLGPLQYATLEACHIQKVLRRFMRSDVPWNETFQVKLRIHSLIVMYEDTKDYGFPITMGKPSSDSSPGTPSQDPPTFKKTVFSLPETQPATFDLLMNWLKTSTVEPTHTAAEGDNEPEDLTILELAQVYLLANRLQIPALMQQVAASLLAFEIDTPTLEDMVKYIGSATTPTSDLRRFLIDAIACCATPEAVYDALLERWMSPEILSALTMAFVRRRDEMQKKLEEDGLEDEEPAAKKKCRSATSSKKRGAAEDVAEEQKETPAKGERGSATSSKKRGAAEDVAEEQEETPAKGKHGSATSSKKRGAAVDVVEEQKETPAKGKRGSSASSKKRGAAEDAGAPKGKRSKKSTG
ncbi:MAG: hypothetical protein FRX48_04853 [Lasallia pustulata]|uniref:Uncharacterized protein n=1 Tax=Lasallia pustulata TaxID=136370 RepID=A0A5M8PSA8_9LECA|nr:MAG: hypothetical protein FRX48_04853 [Lasallia pustulata]